MTTSKSKTKRPVTSKKRLKELAAKPDSEIDYSDIPELGPEFWKKAELVRPTPKEAISLRIDADVLAWFRRQGKGYQSLMNAVLKSYCEAHASSSSQAK